MSEDNLKYRYKQVDVYKEELEVKHLKRKAIIVNILLAIFGLVLLFFQFTQNLQNNSLFPLVLVIGVLIFINSILISLDYHSYANLKLSMYTTILGAYVIVISLIFVFETPSVFTSLFLAYALTSIYQDQKAMNLSTAALLISGVLIVVLYPEFLLLNQQTNPDTLFILVFVLVFVLLLSLSSYILIKRKTFFYNQIATIKEAEIRNIMLMNNMEKKKTLSEVNFDDYYDDLISFSNALSDKIGIENLFVKRVNILKDIKQMSLQEVMKKHPDFTKSEIEELINLTLNMESKIIRLAIKASKSKDLHFDQKGVFSETEFKSFNHESDSKYAKIIAFSVFYTLLKMDKSFLDGINEPMLSDIIMHSEYLHRIDDDILEIYNDNIEVFNTIINDYVGGEQ